MDHISSIEVDNIRTKHNKTIYRIRDIHYRKCDFPLSLLAYYPYTKAHGELRLLKAIYVYRTAQNFTMFVVIRRSSYHLVIYGGRLNKKDGLTRYVDSYVKDKTS